MTPNPLLALVIVILLVAALLSWKLERDFLPLRRDQKWALYALLLLAAYGSLGTYIYQTVAWEPGADSWLVGLLILALGGVALWLAHRME